MAEKKEPKKHAAPPAADKGKVKAPAKKAAAPRPPRKAARPAAPPRKAKPGRAAPPPPLVAEQASAPAQAATAHPPRPAAGVHELRPSPGATHSRKRVGRGPGSGHGKTAGRGYKGQKSRTGYRHQRGFEGGQMPLHRRVPKRGFTNIFRVEYDVVNLRDLDRFDSGAQVTPDALAEKRLVRRSRPVKILGDGAISKPLTVSAHKFSAGARASIEAAGGRCEVLAR
jgi:large subunit ribosomal protein L15